MLNFHFFAYAALGSGLSGGDRIFIELSRRWSLKFPVTIYLWKEGYKICGKQNLTDSDVNFKVSSMEPWWRMGFYINYLARIIQGIVTGLSIKLVNKPQTIIYSASEFWMDSLPSFILKLRFKKISWVAAWYQTAPNPLKGFSQNNRKEKYHLNAFFYWLMQLPAKKIISKFADFVVVNNEDEKKQFPELNKKSKVLVCLGAVDTTSIKQYRKEHGVAKKKYDGVFQGRFHPQKGVLELIDIWKQLILKKPSATLAMIGDGPLMQKVSAKIKKEKLQKNIKLFGYVFDGKKKYQIFSQSKLVLHPAFYDSGGMAAAEAMAFGLPGVCFDLPSLKGYYPKGMLKAKVENLDDFKKKILLLLTDKPLYNKIALESKKVIQNYWSWDKRAVQILSSLKTFKS